MKKLLLSTALIASTATFAFAQGTTTAPATDGDTQAPLTGENMTPTNDNAGTTAPETDAPAAGAPAADAPAMDAPATDAPATDAPAMDAPAAGEPTMGTDTTPGVTAANPDMETSTSREGYSPMMTEALTSENLTGANVYSSEDDDVGTISELILDDQGQITQVIVDIGGFLGIGAKPVALTLDELELLQEDDGEDIRAYAPMTREELEALPEYTAG